MYYLVIVYNRSSRYSSERRNTGILVTGVYRASVIYTGSDVFLLNVLSSLLTPDLTKKLFSIISFLGVISISFYLSYFSSLIILVTPIYLFTLGLIPYNLNFSLDSTLINSCSYSYFTSTFFTLFTFCIVSSSLD